MLFTDDQCRAIALEEFSRTPMHMKLKKQFSASGRWIKKFPQEHQINLRKPHLRRRQVPDHEAIAKSITELIDAMKQIDHRHIVNADETS
jgi:hypothetical protein